MFVSDLDRSVAFYAELLAWTIAVHEFDAALLAGPDGGQLYLRRRGPRASHDRCERVLTQQSGQVTRSIRDGFTMVEGRGPDHAPILIAYPGPDEAPRHQVMKRIYSW